MIKKALIVGGGIGGQCAAIALQNAGIQTEIVEILEKFDVYGVGIIQQANALRALDTLGVAEEALRRGFPYGRVKLCLPNGHQIGEAGTPPIDKFPSHNGISRRILHDILKEKADHSGVIYRMGITVAHINEEQDSVHVQFTDGSQGSYDLLIGADGVRSKVREMIMGKYEPRYVGLSVWRYAFPKPADLDTGYIHFGRRSKLGLIPMTADTMYMFLVSAEGENPHIDQSLYLEKLKGYMSEYPIERVQSLIEQVNTTAAVNYRPLETLQLPKPWHKGRVLIIGDAAHATIPQLGSGAALAIEDAVVLAEEIVKTDDLNQTFEAYMNRRYQRCEMVVKASETLGEWELLEFSGKPLPEGANPGMLMGKTSGALTAPI